jgi:NAD(P)-dependent dehydrogenase (short-subunit alcohol dehydrogenase family)
MTGRSVIVTAANSGIGRAAAGALAGAGARVALAVRTVDKGRAAAATMPRETEVRQLDLASLASVREFAVAWDGEIDLLIGHCHEVAQPAQVQIERDYLFGTIDPIYTVDAASVSIATQSALDRGE